MSTAPGAPNSTVSPGAKIPPNASPNAQTTSPHPTLPRRGARDPPAARREDQPHADADLDPDGRRAGLDRMVGPDGPAPVHQVLHPGRRGRRGRLDDLL